VSAVTSLNHVYAPPSNVRKGSNRASPDASYLTNHTLFTINLHFIDGDQYLDESRQSSIDAAPCGKSGWEWLEWVETFIDL
jgi:hypothetical protein